MARSRDRGQIIGSGPDADRTRPIDGAVPPDDALDPDATFDGDEASAASVPLVQCVLDAGHHGQRLDRVAAALAGGHSRSHLQTLIGAGHVRLDGQPATTPATRVRAGQRLRIELVPTAEALSFRPEPVPLRIVHEDADVLVVDKPAGLVVHPGAGNWSGTLLNGLLHRDAGAAGLPRAGIVHRLDKDTSGLMVVARTLPAYAALVAAISARDVRREYLAIAHGAVEAAFDIDAPIGRDPAVRTRMAVVAGGRAALTHVEPVAVDAQGRSALRCRLHTGRTHQIRVHLASRGHPLVADALYGGRPALGLARQALHAQRLAFVHPRSGASLKFEAAPPADFGQAWREVLDGAA